jgi:hypothetical protein
VAQDALPGVLYDFLYRDTGRLTSYYSQIFEGRLTSLEQTDSDRDGSVHTLTGNLQIAKGETSRASEISSSSKRTIDPHDLITTDVLTSLQDGSFLRTDVANAPHGSLVQAQGTIVFADRHILEMASSVFQGLAATEKQKPRSKQDHATLNTYSFIDNFFKKIPLPSAFILQDLNGVQLVGTIKDEGMEEPISTYYFRHGTHGLSDVFLIGIKEIATPTFTLPNTLVLGAAQQASQGLSEFLFPPDALRVTPLALYRKFTSSSPESLIV